MAAIEILGLSKTYSTGFLRKTQKTALLPLQLTVNDGEVFGYLGANGAGKTTTLKLLMGLIAPTAGSARILGRDAQEPGVKAQIGFLPEQPYFYDYLTASELLHYYAQLSGVPAGERSGCVERVLQRVGLPDVAGVQLRKFSKGMLQRAGIAQAILHEPKIVFLDEPMSGLDPMGRREVREIIQALKEEGKTVFFSTHILSDAESLCDRVAVLHKGELRGIGTVADVTTRGEPRMEIEWENAPVTALGSLALNTRSAGQIMLATVAEKDLDAALEALRQAHARLLRVNPVRGTLEEYYLERATDRTEVKA